jgi:serine/threonine-protein kinase
MRADIQRGLSGMPVDAPPTGSYQRTQRMGPSTMMAGGGYGGPTSAIPAYQYGPGDDEHDDGRRGRRWPWIVGILLVLAVLGALAYLLLGGGGKTYPVPQVQGLTLAKAEAALKANHLVPKVVKQTSSTVKAGRVINSSPQFGNLEPANTVVTLFESAGPKQVKVPNLVNQNVTQAQSALTAAGLTPAVRTNSNSTAPAGTVIKESPRAGTLVIPGSTVTLVVSGGGAKVPNEIGQSLQVAQGALGAQGLTYTVNYVPATGGTKPGTVVGMNPKPGTVVAKGTSITLQVAQQATSPPPTSPPPSSSPPTIPPTTKPAH